MLSTGDFSSLSGITVKMLRHYDEIGLLKPALRDGRSRYRYYLADQLVDAHRIVALKAAGFPLSDIAALTAPAATPVARRAAFERQHARVLELRRQAAFQLRQLTALEGLFSGHARTPVSVRAIPDRLMASMRRGDQRRRFSIAEMFERLEVEASRQGARADASPILILHAEDGGDIATDFEAAVPLSRVFEPSAGIRVRTIKGARHAACAVYSGTYDQTDSAVSAIRHWAAQHRAKIAGPLREVYLRFGADQRGYRLPSRWIAKTQAEFVTEIQAPIRFLKGSTR